MYRMIFGFAILSPFLGVFLWAAYAIFNKFSIKMLILIVFALIGSYYVSAIVRAKLSIYRANKHMAFLLYEIASPWNAEQMRHYGTERFQDRSKFTPEEFAATAKTSLGSLQEIIKGPDCVFKIGRFPNEAEQILFAECDAIVRYEKVTARMKIQLVDDPYQPARLFGVLGDSLKLSNFSSVEIIN